MTAQRLVLAWYSLRNDGDPAEHAGLAQAVAGRRRRGCTRCRARRAASCRRRTSRRRGRRSSRPGWRRWWCSASRSGRRRGSGRRCRRRCTAGRSTGWCSTCPRSPWSRRSEAPAALAADQLTLPWWEDTSSPMRVPEAWAAVGSRAVVAARAPTASAVRARRLVSFVRRVSVVPVVLGRADVSMTMVLSCGVRPERDGGATTWVRRCPNTPAPRCRPGRWPSGSCHIPVTVGGRSHSSSKTTTVNDCL